MSTTCLSSPIKLSQQNIPHDFTDLLQPVLTMHLSLSLSLVWPSLRVQPMTFHSVSSGST